MTKEQLRTLDTTTVDALINEVATNLNISRARATDLLNDIDLVGVLNLALTRNPSPVAFPREFGSSPATQTIIQKTSGKAGTAVTAGTGATLYTVTSGKTLYITHWAVTVDALSTWEVRDNGSTGTLVLGGRAAANTPQSDALPTPLKFATNVWFDVGTTGTENWEFSGWEE